MQNSSENIASRQSRCIHVNDDIGEELIPQNHLTLPSLLNHKICHWQGRFHQTTSEHLYQARSKSIIANKIPGGKRNLNVNMNAQQVILNAYMSNNSSLY